MKQRGSQVHGIWDTVTRRHSDFLLQVSAMYLVQLRD